MPSTQLDCSVASEINKILELDDVNTLKAVIQRLNAENKYDIRGYIEYNPYVFTVALTGGEVSNLFRCARYLIKTLKIDPSYPQQCFNEWAPIHVMSTYLNRSNISQKVKLGLLVDICKLEIELERDIIYDTHVVNEEHDYTPYGILQKDYQMIYDGIRKILLDRKHHKQLAEPEAETAPPETQSIRQHSFFESLLGLFSKPRGSKDNNQNELSGYELQKIKSM